uniref:Uncharacterized protein n=1 Tax=Avena sativa TaxID=4498 RepID=A0ACD5YX28_AVESA
MDGSRGVSGDVVCHLQCEISSVEVTGLGCTGGARALFLRCHVPAGGGRTIQIDSQGAEAHVRGVVSWRDVASLTCDGSAGCVRELADTRSVVFEVRRRRKKIMGRAVGSELVGRAEVAWRDVVAVEAGDAAVEERQVALAVPARGGGWTARGDAAPAPVMSVRMSVRVSETAAPFRRSVGSHRETCGCERTVGEDDVFGVVAFGVADDGGE